MAAKKGRIHWVKKGAAVYPLVPPELDVHPLLLTTLHGMYFLDRSDEETVDPDWSLEALEYMGAYLQRLSGPELERVRNDLDRLAAHGRKKKWPKEQVEWAKTLLAVCGVEEEDEA
jgi:hypothetical protein